VLSLQGVLLELITTKMIMELLVVLCGVGCYWVIGGVYVGCGWGKKLVLHRVKFFKKIGFNSSPPQVL
jgi:hypothetical protein